MGSKCEKPCLSGSFGLGCSQNCSCFGNIRCSPQTGQVGRLTAICSSSASPQRLLSVFMSAGLLGFAVWASVSSIQVGRQLCQPLHLWKQRRLRSSRRYVSLNANCFDLLSNPFVLRSLQVFGRLYDQELRVTFNMFAFDCKRFSNGVHCLQREVRRRYYVIIRTERPLICRSFRLLWNRLQNAVQLQSIQHSILWSRDWYEMLNHIQMIFPMICPLLMIWLTVQIPTSCLQCRAGLTIIVDISYLDQLYRDYLYNFRFLYYSGLQMYCV